MNKTILTLLTLLFVTTVGAQVLSTQYYADEWLTKEVPRDKAIYVKTVAKGLKGAVTTDVRNTKKNMLLRSETYIDDEPVGLWQYQTGPKATELDYNFSLEYDEYACEDTIPGIRDYLINNETLQYFAPVTVSGKSISECIWKDLFYPVFAKENGISGKVVLRFTLTEQGTLENVTVIQGSHVQLDKEAARVVRSLKFASPAMAYGHPTRVCITLPVVFKLN
jgi:TonB family protein